MPLSKRRKGFTLVELLVVISIIALLIGILIPAIGQARLTARLTIDQSNLRQHGIGAFNYAGDHKDDMPNLPPGSGNATGIGQASTGSTSRPMGAWGNTVAPVNGLAMTADPLLHGDIWKMYHFAFGEYIVDSANGIGLLNNVFLSAFHSGRRNAWDELAQTGDPDIPAFPNDYKLAGPSESFLDFPLLKAPGSSFPELDAVGNAVWLQPSWRYTLVAVLGNREPSLSQPGGALFWGASTQQGAGGPNNTSAWMVSREWRLFRQYMKKSSFRVPTEKVMFWDPYSFSNNAFAYCWPDAVVPAVMVDGSSRVIRPKDDVLDTTVTDPDERNAISDAFKSGDYVSTHFLFRSSDNDFFVGGRPAWFVTGIWGVETRDIGGKGGLEDDD